MSNLRLPVNYQSPYDVTSLITHLQKGSTLAACFFATSPIDSSTVAMTSFSSDLTGVPGYPGITFKRNTGVSASQVQAESGNAFSQMEASLFLLATGIAEADLLAGKWAHAEAIIFVCNYEALNMGQLIMESGKAGETIQRGIMATFEIKGINNALTAQIGCVTRPECRHDFCDSGCTLVAADYTVTGTVSAVASQTAFNISSLAGTFPTDYFSNGKITFTAGGNTGYPLRIDSYDTATGAFTLRTPAPYLPVIGDTASIIAGCQKRLTDCQDRTENDGTTTVNNVLNFGGFSSMPTLESFSRLPASFGV